MGKPEEDMSDYPALGRALAWVEKPGSVAKLIVVLVLACVIAVAWDLTYDKYGYFMELTLVGFYAAMGFVLMLGLLLVANGWRALVGTAEYFYNPKTTETEDMPEGQIDRKDHNA